MAGTPFITPATAAKWDDGKRGNFVQHVAAKVAKCKEREDTDGVLSLELYELLREGMVGSISSEHVGGALKDLMAKVSLALQHWEDVIGDLLWLLGEEAMEGKDAKTDLKAGIAGVIKQVIANGISAEVVKARVGEEALEAAGLIKSATEAKSKLQRLRTGKVYSQQKFNLLREESEGYSKLIVELEQGLNGLVSDKALEQLMKSTMSLIAYFNLDPNRVLDVMLDVLEEAVNMPEQQVGYFVQLISRFNRTALVNVLGFKFQGHQQASQNPPASLYLLIAVLCRHKALSVKDVYPFLSASDDQMLSAFDKHHERLLTHIKKKRIISIKDVPDKKEEETIDAAPHNQTGDENQKLHVIAAMLEIGDWGSAKYMLTRLAQLLPASYRPVSAGLCKLLHRSLAPVYRSMMASSGLLGLARYSTAGVGEDDHMAVEPDAGEGAEGNTLPLIRDAKDLPKIMPLLQHLSVYVAHDPVLFMKIGRVLKEYLAAVGAEGRDKKFVHETLLAMLGGLVLLQGNASAANYVWDCIKELRYLDRYWIYSELHWRVYLAHPQLLLAREDCREELRKVLKSMTKENVRKKRNLIGQMTHSQPLVVCERMLDAVQEYESMIDICKEALHYCSTLSLDILSYLIVEEMGGSLLLDKPLMLDDDTNLARWLIHLSTFIADMYLKHPRVEMQGLLQHIFNRLSADSFAELLVLRDLLSTMGGIKYDVTTVSKEDVDSRSGGERLRLSIEYPWPTEALFIKALAEGEMGMGREGGAKQMKDFQSAKKEREEATKWMTSNLQNSGLAVSLLIVIAQQISGCLFTKEAIKNERVKYSSWLHNQCHHTMLVLCDFLWRRVPVAEYAKRLPSPIVMVQQLRIEPSLALLISRPTLRWSDAGSTVDLAQCAKELLSATPQNLKTVSPMLYTCFWSLTLNDISVPFECYETQTGRLKKAIADLDNTDRLDPKAKEKDIKKWKENLALELDKMEKEHKKQVENKKKIRARVEKEKSSLVHVPGKVSTLVFRATAQFFLQTCVFSRCVQSPEDAVFCAKFIQMLHNIKTPNLSTMIIYNMIINSVGPMVFSRTEQEAKHLGMFLAEMLTTINAWAKDPAQFKRECENYPGFLNYPKNDDPQKCEAITFEQFNKAVGRWHQKLSGAFCNCLVSKEAVEVHNALTILSGLVPGAFPIHDTTHKDVKDKVNKMTDDRQHNFGNSITVMAKSINARLQMCEDKMIKLKKKKEPANRDDGTGNTNKIEGSNANGDTKTKRDDPPASKKVTEAPASKKVTEAPASKKATEDRKDERSSTKADDDRVRKRGRVEEDPGGKGRDDSPMDSRVVRAKKEGEGRSTPPARGAEPKGEAGKVSASGPKKEEGKNDERNKVVERNMSTNKDKDKDDRNADRKDDRNKDDGGDRGRRDSKGTAVDRERDLGNKRERSPARSIREKILVNEGTAGRGGSPASAGKPDDKSVGTGRDLKRRREDEDKSAMPLPADRGGAGGGADRGRSNFSSGGPGGGGGGDREAGERGGGARGASGNFSDGRDRERRVVQPPRSGTGHTRGAR